METMDTLALMAARIQAAWEASRICTLIGRAARARVVRIGRLIAEDRLDAAEGLKLARESEGVAFMFAPLPGGEP